MPPPSPAHQNYFYHGTNTQQFSTQLQQGFYSGKEGCRINVEHTLYYALLTGIYSCRKREKERKTILKKPLLIALPAEKYWDALKMHFLSTGINPSARYELHGKIALEDLVVVDSLEKLQEVCPSATERERKRFARCFL